MDVDETRVENIDHQLQQPVEIAPETENAETDSAETENVESDSSAEINPFETIHAETDHSYSSNTRRSHQPPVWLSDYECGEGLSDGDHQGNFALYVDADPLSYEVAAQS
ncbi:hypothetical protein OIU78_000017, partial [Salix suchowensis]